MPSHTVPDALVMLHDHNGAPWNWNHWQDVTGIIHGLFPDDDKLLPTGWTRANALDVKTYFDEYNKIATEEAKLKFSKKTKLPGREFWSTFINKMWKKWHVHDVIIQGLRKHGVHPIHIMKAMNSFDDWPSAEHYVPKALDTIGYMLFGEDAYMKGDTELLHPSLRKPLTHIVQRSWNAIRMKNKSDLLNMTKLRDAAVGAVDEIDKGKVLSMKITRAIRTVSRWKAVVDLYGTEKDVTEAQSMLEKLEQAMALLQNKEPKSEVSKEKKLQYKKFRNHATEDEIEELTHLYDEYFQPTQADEDDEPALGEDVYCASDLDAFGFGHDALGMEEEAHLSLDALAKALSFVARLPHQFNTHRHATGLNAWDQPGAFRVKKGDGCTELNPLSLHWHQLAGIHSAARNLFSSEPVACTRGLLVADEVGLGKTALSIAIIAFLNQVKTLQDREHRLPFLIREKAFLTQRDTIDSLPHLIVCPGTLRAQWIAELKTLFKPRSVDILLYDGGSKFWSHEGAFGSSKQDLHNRIIVMTHSLLFNEMRRVYEKEARKGQRPWEYPDQKRSLDGSVFGQKFLTIVIDEGHQMRNMGNKHWATLRILEQATVRLILTATPLLTSPRDIAAMGRLTGVPHFRSEQSLDDEKEFSAAIRRAKKQEDMASVRKLQVEAVRKLQKYFHNWILRRTTDSRDWMGRTLLSLPPHKDIIGVLQLTERETQIIHERAELAKACVISANETGKFQTKKFYLEYRTAVGYAKDDPDMPNPKFKSLAEWEPVKSTKMDVCARICQHYLTSDSVFDVTFEDGQPIFINCQPNNLSSPAKRRILIYAEFPSMTPLLRNVLSLYSVQSLSIDGKMKFDRRDKVIKQFHQENQPRVLIFSSVGSAGLNLSIADVVIFFDQPWSAQDERQIRGRAHRQPQEKAVKAIHLLASDSSDLLMNDMARGKRDMFDAFVNKTLGQELRDLLSGKAIEGDISDEEELEDNREKRKKRKSESERGAKIKMEKKKDKEAGVLIQKKKDKGKKLEHSREQGNQVAETDEEAPSVQAQVVAIPHEKTMDISQDEMHTTQVATIATATSEHDTSGSGLLSLINYPSSPPPIPDSPSVDLMMLSSSPSPGPSGPTCDEDASSKPSQAFEQAGTILPTPAYPEDDDELTVIPPPTAYPEDDDELTVIPPPTARPHIRPSFPPAKKRVKLMDKTTKQSPCTNSDGSREPRDEHKKMPFSGLKSLKRSSSAFSSQASSSATQSGPSRNPFVRPNLGASATAPPHRQPTSLDGDSMPPVSSLASTRKRK